VSLARPCDYLRMSHGYRATGTYACRLFVRSSQCSSFPLPGIRAASPLRRRLYRLPVLTGSINAARRIFPSSRMISDSWHAIAMPMPRSDPAADENRVVFYGDSTTDLWKLEESFPGKRYVNRGIGGQTTSQMLVRFVRM
jgi:hypothetical protein